jgi:hypothetical protein
MGLHLRSRRLQFGAAAKAHGGIGVRAPANCRLIGRWRIVQTDIGIAFTVNRPGFAGGSNS